MRFGVLGGTFDPVHYGHLLAAEEARSALGLDRVFFVPAHLPPHKLGHRITPDADRLAMVELAIASNPAFCLSRVDIDRDGPSFTVDTISLLQRDWGIGAEAFFIMGADSLCDLLTWREPARLLELCQIAVVGRFGFRSDLDHLLTVAPGARERVHFVPMPLVEISSTEIRRRVAEGRSIKYQLPESVEAYLTDLGLYRNRIPPNPIE